MDLKLLQSSTIEEGSPMVVWDPRDKTRRTPLGGPEAPITLIVRSKDSLAYRKALHVVIRKGAKTASEVDDEGTEFDVAAENEAAVLATLIVGWQNVEWSGSPLPFSVQNAVMLLEALPFIREQVEAFASWRGNYLGN